MKRIACGVLLALAASAALAASPSPGRYDGRFCVTAGDAPESCGPVDVTLQTKQRVRLRIADIEYRLQLRRNELEVVLMQGTMLIDGFVAPYDFDGQVLRFDDREKATRYALTLGERHGRSTPKR